ncbi:hypothetical protein C9J21_20585 [Photobacterium phosphoreum]|uniref:PFL_4695 family integrating conjugative element protein n=1 Tax=Photobacterium phosphoreum TaxID=659 RepID=UPI000D17D454|nr:integrating conjugative element protein [Photobacterium phosphoreum]PSW28393.1 hypothetical protein C9J21_20585 [Photobacterium phosphoreum]
MKNTKLNLVALITMSLSTNAIASKLIELPKGTISTIALSKAVGDDAIVNTNTAIQSQKMVHAAELATSSLADKKTILKEAVAAIFPVITPSMSPRKNQPYTLFDKPIQGLNYPIAVIGNDQLSINWLKRHREQLIAKHAVVMLVEVESDQEYKNILAIANGLRVIPVSGQSLSDNINANYYPVLITSTGMGQ